MAIRVVCPSCRRRSKFPDQFAGHMAECRKCRTMLTVPGAAPQSMQVRKQSPATRPTPEPHSARSHVGSARWNKWSLAGAREYWVGRRMERELDRERERELDRKRDGRRKAVPRRRHSRRQVAGSRCHICEHGKMRTRTAFRFGRVIGAVGYAMLIPAILGLLLNFVVLATVAFDLAEAVSGATRIPVPTIETVMRINDLSDKELALMTPEQLRAVKTARIATAGATLGGVGSDNGGAGYGVVLWLVVGLVGRLLSTKKQMLRCTTCDATQDVTEQVL